VPDESRSSSSFSSSSSSSSFVPVPKTVLRPKKKEQKRSYKAEGKTGNLDSRHAESPDNSSTSSASEIAQFNLGSFQENVQMFRCGVQRS
jgi:hypothetical protein